MENPRGWAALDGAKLARREDAMAYFSGILPDLQGRNLDALYDCLTDFHEDAEIRLVNEAALREHLGNYALLLEKVLQRAANDNALIGWAAE
jgi:RNAse (barnase) inhibitor barstar